MGARASHAARIISFCPVTLLVESGAVTTERRNGPLSLALICFCCRRCGFQYVSLFTKKAIKFHLLRPNCSVLCGVVIPFGNYSFQFVISSG